jgi:hypothetical protein
MRDLSLSEGETEVFGDFVFDAVRRFSCSEYGTSMERCTIDALLEA